MLPGKVRFVTTTGILFVAFLATSAGDLTAPGALANAQDPAKPQKGEDRLKGLLNERLAVSRDCAKQVRERLKSGNGTLEELIEPTRMLLEAELDVCESTKERIAVLEKFLGEAKDIERLAEGFAKTGRGRTSTALMAKAQRLGIEIALERAKANAPAKSVEGKAGQDLRDQVGIAEIRVAIKRAAVKVVAAHGAKAQTSLNKIKVQATSAKLAESLAEKQFERLKKLFDANSIEERLLDEQRSKWEAAKAHRAAAEAQVAEAECQVDIEHARIVQAEMELAESELRLKQLKPRMGPSSNP